MKRAVQLVILIPIAIVVIALSVANRHEVVFSVDPFNAEDPAFAFELPLYWLLFAAAAIGVILGGVATWMRQGRWRRAARRDHAEMERLRRDRERIAANAPLPPPGEGRAVS